MKTGLADITVEEEPTKVVGLIISRHPDGSVGILASLQIEALIKMVYSEEGDIPEVWSPMRTTWNAAENDEGDPFDIEQYRKATGLITWIVRARLDIQPAYTRIASRTHSCTARDWQDVRDLTAYLDLTKNLPLNYHRRGEHDGGANVSGAADASYLQHADGSSYLAGGTKAWRDARTVGQPGLTSWLLRTRAIGQTQYPMQR
jgi:hypothetical protein